MASSADRAHLIMVCYWFPPSGGMSSLVALNYANAALEVGCRVTVVSPRLPESHPLALPDPALQSQVSEGVVQIKTFPGWAATAAALLAKGVRKRGGKPADVRRLVAGAQPHSVRRFLYENALRSLMIPDTRADWLPHALAGVRAALRASRAPERTAVFTYGFPFTSYFVGWVAKRFWRTKWILFEGDMWTHNPDFQRLPPWRRALDRWLERMLFLEADRLIVTTEPMRNALLGTYGAALAGKVSILPVGYDEAEYACSGRDSAQDISDRRQQTDFGEVFHLVYTGTISHQHNAVPLCDALQSLGPSARWQLTHTGHVDPAARACLERLGRRVRFLGLQERPQVVALQKRATVLVSFGMAGGMQIPAKLIEYQAAGRPILLLGEAGEDDLSVQWAAEAGHACTVENSAAELEPWLRQAYSAWETGTLESVFPPRRQEPVSWREVGEAFGKLVAQTVNGDDRR